MVDTQATQLIEVESAAPTRPLSPLAGTSRAAVENLTHREDEVMVEERTVSERTFEEVHTGVETPLLSPTPRPSLVDVPLLSSPRTPLSAGIIASTPRASAAGSISPTIRPAAAINIQRSKKIKRGTTDDEFSLAINNLAKSLGQPIVVQTNNSQLLPTQGGHLPDDPAVDSFMSFIGHVLKSFKDEELKLDVINTVTQTVVNAKAVDVQRLAKK